MAEDLCVNLLKVLLFHINLKSVSPALASLEYKMWKDRHTDRVMGSLKANYNLTVSHLLKCNCDI